MNMDYGRNNGTNGDGSLLQNNINMTSDEFSSKVLHCSNAQSISKLSDLSLDMFHEIFDYLTLGDIYHSFYHINNLLKNFIDTCYPSLHFISMSYHHFIFYNEHISLNNTEHCQKIHSLVLSNEKPFDHIERMFPIINLYTNLKKLHLYSPNANQMKMFSLIIPNLRELYINLTGEKLTNINWLSSWKQLEICSIDSETYSIEIDQSMSSFPSSLSCLSIVLSSTYDFYNLLSRLSVDNLHCLNISLFDNEFSYMKTVRSPIRLATNLSNFSFNMSLRPMKDASCLYDIIRFISHSFRCIETLTILCRLADGIFIDEEKFRNYLSFVYSVKNYKLFIEMNNLPISTDNEPVFNEISYTYPFWIDKDIHVNIYRNKNKEIKRVRIYTLPLVPKIFNLPNYSEDMYQIIKSLSSNIHHFISNDLHDPIYNFTDDRTLTPKRIYSSSNVSLLPYLPRVSSFQVTENGMMLFLSIFSQSKSFPNIRKLQFDHLPALLMENTRQVFDIFPCLQSVSIGKVNDFDTFGTILDKFLVVLPNKPSLIHLHVGGSYFDNICPVNLDENQFKTNLGEIFLPLCQRNNSYDISFNRHFRFVDIWL